MRREGSAILVDDVVGPALEAGVQLGDTLELLNGAAAASFDDIGLAHALSKCDEPVTLSFRRSVDGTRARFTYDVQPERRKIIEQNKLMAVGN